MSHLLSYQKISLCLPSLKRRRGFTLIETIVAVAVLLATIVGPLTIAQKSLASAVYAKDQTIAFYLAEEAIEYIRSIRDENSYRGNEKWTQGLEECLSTPGNTKTCGIDTNASSPSLQIVSCGDKVEGCKLSMDTTSGVYGYGRSTESWRETPFIRTVTVTETVPNKEMRIKVRMEWQTGAFPKRTFTLESHLLNWRQ